MRPALLLMPALALSLACAAPKSEAPEAKPESAAAAAADHAAGEARDQDAAMPLEEAPAAEPPAPDADASPVEQSKARDAPGTALSPSRLEIAVPSINGGLNRDIIRRIASDHADDIRSCHGRALASTPGLSGKIVVELELDDGGRVLEARLTKDSSLPSRELEACVLALIEGWSFSDAGGKGGATLTFELGV